MVAEKKKQKYSHEVPCRTLDQTKEKETVMTLAQNFLLLCIAVEENFIFIFIFLFLPIFIFKFHFLCFVVECVICFNIYYL